jgi:phosphonate metabolism protein PhnN/1,5-bisphosphokinase (PRPP-forming)
MSGAWVFVCGPSGAGKDSVLAWAAEHLADRRDIVFARRVVTRSVQPGSDHDPITPQQFALMRRTGELAWCWQAHGFDYGIAAHYCAEVATGRTVVVNGSREHASNLESIQSVRVVQIMVDAEQLAVRLARRGRDDPEQINQRLLRNARFNALRADHTILNQGVLASAGRELANYLGAGANGSDH